MTAQATRDPRTREERSAAMQLRILEATLEVLVEKGYCGTSTLEVQQRAGVSRGALLHHYGSRTDLMVAAVRHITRERIIEFHAPAPPKKGRVEWAVRSFWETFQGPTWKASLELWVAATHDPELREALKPQERMLGQVIRGQAADVFGPEMAAKPGFPMAVELLFDAQRGAAARAVLRTAESDDRLIESWVVLVNAVAEQKPR